MAYTMTDDELLEDIDFPTLNSVVESGDETIIQTSRIGYEVIRELRSVGAYSEPHIHVGTDSEKHALQQPFAPAKEPDTAPPRTTHPKNPDDPAQLDDLAQIIESRVSAVVEDHVSALKKDIARIVHQAVAEAKKNL